MGKVLRIDMGALSVREEPTPPAFELLGGRALTSSLALAEIDPLCDPLGPGNRLIFAPGLLGGTAATTSGRTSFGGKSPLTGGVKEANVGGTLGHRLARLGVKAVVVENAPADGQWRLLRVGPDGCRFESAGELAGLGAYDTVASLLENPRSQTVVCIGPAGEHEMAAASIAVSDPEGRPTRHAARGGLGAVMGSKRLKAIVVDDGGAKNQPSADPEGFRRAMLAFSNTVREDPRTANMSAYGTAGVIRFVNRDNVMSMPTRNHRRGMFEGGAAVSGQRIAELAPERGGKMLPCMAGCIIKCAILFNDARGEHVTTALEFETLALLGSNLEIDDLDGVAHLDRLGDDIGLDTIETGNAIGVAMEAGVLPWGDWQAVAGLLDEVRKGTDLGRIIGGGTVNVARHYGIGRVPAVRGQGLPAWEPRTLKGVGITYATSPQGADHTAGLVTARGVTVDTLLKSSQSEQVLMAVVDTAGLCQFSNPTLKDMAGLVSLHVGRAVSEADLAELGKRVLREEREFNIRASVQSEGGDAGAIPAFLRGEPLTTSDGPQTFDVPGDAINRFWETL